MIIYYKQEKMIK